MIRKLTLAVGLGAGYVLGAKAGTQRYDQIVTQFNEFLGKPAVKNATSTVQQTAGDLAGKAKATVNDKIDSGSGSSDTDSLDLTVPVSTTSAYGDPLSDPLTAPMPGAAASMTAPDIINP